MCAAANAGRNRHDELHGRRAEDLLDGDYELTDARAAIQAGEDRQVTRAALVLIED